MMHDLKVWPGIFVAMLQGLKTAEYRKIDRSFQVGDILKMQEWSPTLKAYTEGAKRSEVTHIM